MSPPMHHPSHVRSGFPECWYSWRHQMAAFREDYDVVAMDMRYGHEVSRT